MHENIKEFVENRPEVIAAYGYGSGVFKQSGYNQNEQKQIDLIFVVDDLKKWHLANIEKNPNDYSYIGKYFFNNANEEQLKRVTGVTYQSDISENGNLYKFGTIEENDLIKYLTTWQSFYMPGRFQKTTYPIIENSIISSFIRRNRCAALMVASFLQDGTIASKKDLLKTLVGLSYLGDTRMAFAENPRKIENIVDGSYDEYLKIYDFKKPYLQEELDGNYIINKEIIKSYIYSWPVYLKEYIKMNSYSNDEELKNIIRDYFININKSESIHQTIKGLKTNGVVRSSVYAARKISKRFKK